MLGTSQTLPLAPWVTQMPRAVQSLFHLYLSPDGNWEFGHSSRTELLLSWSSLLTHDWNVGGEHSVTCCLAAEWVYPVLVTLGINPCLCQDL